MLYNITKCSTLLCDDDFTQELKKSICLLKSYIHSLKVHEKIKQCHHRYFDIPDYLLCLVERLVPLQISNCKNHECNCNRRVSSIYSKTQTIHKINNKRFKYRTCHNIINQPCLESVVSPLQAVYCDPHTYDIKKLTRKDIFVKFKPIFSEIFTKNIKLVIAKYEGFVDFFEKVLEQQ